MFEFRKVSFTIFEFYFVFLITRNYFRKCFFITIITWGKMKTQICILCIALVFSINSYAQNVDLSKNKAAHLTYLPLLVDPKLTMRSGAESIITFHTGLVSAEDKLINTRWFSESGIFGKTGGVSGRLAKYILVDIPVDIFSVVLAHEYFGHGARYRELDMDDIFYKFDMPPPYGGGGGQASNTKSVSISTHELLAIWEGGVEVHPVINRKISMRWMAKNEINYREASQFFWSFQIMTTYIQDSKEDLADGTKDNDLRAYVRYINSNAGYTDVASLRMSVKDLKSKMIINAFNPFVFYSLYSILKTYLWGGSISNEMPVLNFGAVDYLPGLRAGLTPFGVEYHFENYLRYNNTVSFIDFSYGDQSFHDSWGGIGLNIQNIYKRNSYKFDMNLNIWKQPEIQIGSNPTVLKSGGIGGALSVRGYYDFPNSEIPMSALLELGYKTTGFLEGYNLDSSPIFMIGLAFRN